MAEKRIPFAVFTDWQVDGNLLPLFSLEDYPGLVWKAGQIRCIPRTLALACQKSGALIMQPEPGMQEDNYREPGPPVIIPVSEIEQRYRSAFAREPKVRVMSLIHFEDGSDDIRARFSALDRPPVIGMYEIIDLPASMVKLLEQGGAEFTSDPGEMEQFEGGYQFRFTSEISRVTVWRKEREAKQRAEAARSEKEQRNKETSEQIERLTSEFLEAERKGNKAAVARLTKTLDTLWARVV